MNNSIKYPLINFHFFIMKDKYPLFLLLFVFSYYACSTSKNIQDTESLSFNISFPTTLSNQALDGRLLLLLSNNEDNEPRFQIADGPNSQLAFGIDVENLNPDQFATFDASVFGYPLKSIADIPKGTYSVQALLHIYETFNRADGHIVKLPMDRGEGQQWNRAPGNLYSTPKKIRIDPAQNGVINIELDQKIPIIELPKDSKYIKHIKIKSDLLSKFWGRDMYLGAHILLPKGFEEHPDVKYPLAIMHGHFPYDFGGFSEDATRPPDLKPTFSARFGMNGYNVTPTARSL